MISLKGLISLHQTVSGQFTIDKVQLVEERLEYSEYFEPLGIDLSKRFATEGDAENAARGLLVQYAKQKYGESPEITWATQVERPTWTAYFTDESGATQTFHHMIIRRIDEHTVILQSTFEDHRRVVELPKTRTRLVEEGR